MYRGTEESFPSNLERVLRNGGMKIQRIQGWNYFITFWEDKARSVTLSRYFVYILLLLFVTLGNMYILENHTRERERERKS